MENFEPKVTYDVFSNFKNPNVNIKLYSPGALNFSYFDRCIQKQQSESAAAEEFKILTFANRESVENSEVGGEQNLGKYRSVVFFNNKLVCFSPPKSIKKEIFIRKHPEEFSYEPSVNQIPETICITETIEGTMINLFYDFHNKTWEIATKNAIGGRYWYFSRPDKNDATKPLTFRDMFMDAIGEKDFVNLNQTLLVSKLPKNYCYSFVLQHPENHIVLDIVEPRVYLVAVYEICESRAKYLPLPYVENLPYIRELLDANIIYTPTTIQYSEHLHHHSERKVATFDQSLCERGFAQSPRNYVQLELHLNYCASYSHMMGLTLIDTETGDRMKLENQQYNYKKSLRGNHPNLQYQYLCLLRIQKIPEFLKYFPIYREHFDRFNTQFEQFVNTIQTTYYMWYVKKQKDVEFSKHIMYFVRRIHYEVFVPSLNGGMQRTIVTKAVVKDWLINTFNPGSIMYGMRQEN